MKTFKVFGVPSSIAVNNERSFIAVGYYDESIITIHNIDNGKLLNKINTEYCSAYSNLIKTNSKYFVYLHSAKLIKVLDSKNLKELFSFELNDCGSINSIELKDNNLFIFANSPIGDKSNKKDIFIYDLELNKKSVFDSGIYIKKGTVIDNKIVIFGNYLANKKDHGCVRIVDLNNFDHIDETLIFDGSSIEEVVLYEVTNNQKIRSFVSSASEDMEASLESLSFGFDLSPSIHPRTIVGCIKPTENTLSTVVVITQKPDSKAYKISRYGTSEDVETLPFEVVTGATASTDSKFYFGVDKSISIVEL